jgi:hypothetical protein
MSTNKTHLDDVFYPANIIVAASSIGSHRQPRNSNRKRSNPHNLVYLITESRFTRYGKIKASAATRVFFHTSGKRKAYSTSAWEGLKDDYRN